jgi:hypothetical protein
MPALACSLLSRGTEQKAGRRVIEQTQGDQWVKIGCSATCICSCALAFFGFTSAEKRRALGAGGLARIFAATLVGDGCRAWSVALVARRQRLHDRYDRRDISRWIARPPMRSSCRRLFSAHLAAKVVKGAAHHRLAFARGAIAR